MRSRFKVRAAVPWFLIGGLLLVALIVAAAVAPERSHAWEQASSILSLFFLVAAAGYTFQMGPRALWIATAFVLVLYPATAFIPWFGADDVFLVTIIASLLLFMLAGFNLLFVLEEMVFDVYRLVRLRSRLWGALPVVVLLVLVIGIPILDASVEMDLGTLRFVAPVVTAVLVVTWLLRAVLRGRGAALTREAHLFAAGGVAGAGLADLLSLLEGGALFLPAIVAYGAIFGTWIYVSFTTLQRAQYFLPGSRVEPWTALLLSSSFAVLAHVHAQFRLGGVTSLAVVFEARATYLILGVWLGLAFFALRGLWRVFASVRDERGLGSRTRAVAGRLARVTEELLDTEHAIEEAAYVALRGADRLLPGQRHPPKRPAAPEEYLEGSD